MDAARARPLTRFTIHGKDRIDTEAGALDANHVVVALGPWAPDLLKPLGVTTPHPVYPSPDMVERMALPYGAGGSFGKPEPTAQVHFDVYPAGDIYLTPEDMARYLIAQLNGGVVDGKRMPGRAALAARGIAPVVLGPKEGLALINGTQAHTSIAALASAIAFSN